MAGNNAFALNLYCAIMVGEIDNLIYSPYSIWLAFSMLFAGAQGETEGSQRLFELWKQIPERRMAQSGVRSPLEQLRHLLIRLSEHWASYRVFDWQKDVPWTNNGTEQAIGRMQMRSRTVRGYKSWPGMWVGLLLIDSGVA